MPKNPADSATAARGAEIRDSDLIPDDKFCGVQKELE
jgi:hypothetical protein